MTQVTRDIFKLKSPCADCPFRKEGGVRHGYLRALEYAGHFIFGRGATFPCHRSVPEHIDRSGPSAWQAGQQMCAGGLIFAEHVNARSLTVEACIAMGAHDPATLTDADQVFGSLPDLVNAHIVEESE